VQQARAAAAQGSASFDAVQALVQITTIAAVQQQELAASISGLAAQIAGDPSLDVAAASAQLEAVRGIWRGAGLKWRGLGAGGGGALGSRPLPHPEISPSALAAC
jgi:hypothetical protein